MKNIFFITGASGVGKTSLILALREKYKNNKNWFFLRFDSNSLPTPEEMTEEFGSGENWQKETTYTWIKKALNKYKSDDVIIFEGQRNLQFIKDGFFQNNFSNYEIILIDCNEDTMAKRLIEYRNQPELLTQDMKNWLNFLRRQAKDFKVNIIETSNKTKSEVLKSFEQILKKYHVL